VTVQTKAVTDIWKS